MQLMKLFRTSASFRILRKSRNYVKSVA